MTTSQVSKAIASRYISEQEAVIELIRQVGDVCLWLVMTQTGHDVGSSIDRTEFHVSNGSKLKFMHVPDQTVADQNFEREIRRNLARNTALAEAI
jgi:hypothetical protein